MDLPIYKLFGEYLSRLINYKVGVLDFIVNSVTGDATNMNSMKLVIPLHSLCWSIHTKDESKRETAFAFIFGVN